VNWLLLLAVLQVEPREVLCLYDSAESAEPAETRIHRFAEVILNHLGLIARYHDIRKALPETAARGILTWFSRDDVPRPAEYWNWIGRAEIPVVVLGRWGTPPSDEMNRALARWGLENLGQESWNRALLEPVHVDPLAEFERTIEGELPSYIHIRSSTANRVFLRVRRIDLPESESDLVVLGSWGGFAWDPIHEDSVLDRHQWRIDPFRFFSSAFGVEEVPRPDLTTAMGRRILFVHIDGDGLINPVRAGKYAGRLAGEIVRDEFLRAYDLPATASIIGRHVEGAEALVRSLLDLPNVEVAAHGFDHPIDWRKGTLSYPGTFSLEREIDQAVRTLNQHTSKPVSVYLWSGVRNPDSSALAACERLGLRNLNGGDSFLDGFHPSYSHLQPVTVPRGSFLQFNNRASSENQYTDRWTRNFHAFRNVLTTFERTERPIRILPVNLYYHYYVVDHPAGERALREIYEWLLRQDLFPMTASEYVAWVRGFLQARIEKVGKRTWKVSEYGSCSTIRWDATDEVPDLEKSRNVIGFRKTDERLYVHLGEGREATIVLARELPRTSYLIESNGHWRNGRIESRTAAFARFGTADGERVFRGGEHRLQVDVP